MNRDYGVLMLNRAMEIIDAALSGEPAASDGAHDAAIAP
jgi:hypothetical protein